jgi:hypothetical protein
VGEEHPSSAQSVFASPRAAAWDSAAKVGLCWGRTGSSGVAGEMCEEWLGRGIYGSTHGRRAVSDLCQWGRLRICQFHRGRSLPLYKMCADFRQTFGQVVLEALASGLVSLILPILGTHG